MMIRVFLILVLLSGCVTQQPLQQNLETERLVENRSAVYLTKTPFFPQQQFQCGPAALATLLVESGVDVSPGELISQVYIPEKQGSLQIEMLAAGRQYARVPYQLDPTEAALFNELFAGRPVLILQNLGFETKPFWHYAVVVGYEPERDEMILRSGTEADKHMSMDKFLQTWRRAENWAFVLLTLDELPTNPDFDRYFQSVLNMEQVLKAEQMIELYEYTSRQFPQQTIAAFGLADAYSRSGHLSEAISLYKGILTANPEHVAAANNLAVTLQELSCLNEARQMAEKAVSLSLSNGQFVSESQDTLQDIINQQQALSDQCQIDFQITSVYAQE